MSQWYIAIDGQQHGPMDQAEAVARARSHPGAYGWRPGFEQWKPVTEIAELTPPPVAAPAAPPPALAAGGAAEGGARVMASGLRVESGGWDMPAGRSPQNAPAPSHTAAAAAAQPVAPGLGGRNAHEIDFVIKGAEMQFVEIELDPGESVIAEAGSMMFKAPSVTMTTIFGDGSNQDQGRGFMGRMLRAGGRLLTGESLFITVFTHEGRGKARVAFAAPYPGNIIPIDLTTVGGRLVAQKDSFLCAARGVSVGIALQRKILTGLFGGEGFIMQTLEGDGWVFVHAGGTLVEMTLAAGEGIHVDTGCVAAYCGGIDMDIERAGSVRTMIFGGEGLFFARLRGPGKVWLQSLPFSRMAGRMLSAATVRSQGEGSVLGPLGNLLDGDNR